MPEFIELLISYSNGRGEATVTFHLPENNLVSLVAIIDAIGWFSLMEGEIPTLPIQYQETFYKNS